MQKVEQCDGLHAEHEASAGRLETSDATCTLQVSDGLQAGTAARSHLESRPSATTIGMLTDSIQVAGLIGFLIRRI